MENTNPSKPVGLRRPQDRTLQNETIENTNPQDLHFFKGVQDPKPKNRRPLETSSTAQARHLIIQGDRYFNGPKADRYKNALVS